MLSASGITSASWRFLFILSNPSDEKCLGKIIKNGPPAGWISTAIYPCYFEPPRYFERNRVYFYKAPRAMQKSFKVQWELFLHDRGSFPELIQCVLLHEQFEAIHPFLDGNGRIGRLLITLFLIERGRLSQPLLYLSAYIEAYRQEYYDLFQRVRTQGDWNSWLHYVLRGVEETSKQAVRQAGALRDKCT